MERHHTSPLAAAHAWGPEASVRFAACAAATGTTEAMAGADPLARTAGLEEFASRNGAARHRHERLAGDGNASDGNASEASPRPSFACGYFLRADRSSAYPSRRRRMAAVPGRVRRSSDDSPEER